MNFLRKNYIKIIIINILLIILVYASNINAIPNSVILFNNEELNLKTIFGINLEESITVGANISEEKINNNKIKEYNLNIFGFNVKTVTANVVENTKVIPLGNIAGLKLYTKGVLVVGMSEITDENNNIYKPYEKSGIQEGDYIIEVNNVKINTTEELIDNVKKSKEDTINITYLKDGNEIKTTITPVKTSRNTYKLGLWVRDTAAGVGTLTFYNKKTNSIATLGHGIQDVDTEKLVEILSGELVTAQIQNIKKGEENNPGRIEGNIDNSSVIAKIYSNTEYGVYSNYIEGTFSNIENNEEIYVATRNEIKEEKASIICTIENGETKEYEVEIQKKYINNNSNNKSMIIKITDKELIQKTGGIIQGMSGAPIIQNGKLIGALTHVFVSDPTKGYGVFADMMLKELNSNY